MQQNCKNCDTNLQGKFCKNCGQKANIHPLTFRHIFHEVFHAFTHADKSFLVMLKKMITGPGNVAYEYIVEGKRQRYYNPFTFFLLVTAINAFVESSLLTLKENIFHDNNEYARLFNAYNKAMLLLIIPCIAFAFFALHHKKSRGRYSEYTVFAMMLFSMKTTIDIIVNAFNLMLVYFFHIYRGLDDYVLYIVLIAFLVAVADRQFHIRFYKTTWLKSIIAALLFCIIIAGINIFIVWAFLRHFDGLGYFMLYGVKISG
ncbi:MAG: DUF3667 domain-containing protein [Ferruginibacter sp.]